MARPADDMKTRQIAFALLQTPYRQPSRNDGLKFMAGLGERGLPDLSYRFNENLQRDGTAQPSLTLATQEGRRKTEIKIDFLNQALRLFINFFHPESRDVAIREADIIHDLFLEQLGAGLDQHLAEARVAVDIPTSRATAITSLGGRFFGHDSLSLLGHVDFLSVSLNTAPERRAPTSRLDNPTRQIRVEKLREDPRRIFVETISQWHKMIIQPLEEQPGSAEVIQGPLSVQEGTAKPSQCIEEATEYIRNNVIPFILAKRTETG